MPELADKTDKEVAEIVRGFLRSPELFQARKFINKQRNVK
jgi:hypothetical protein